MECFFSVAVYGVGPDNARNSAIAIERLRKQYWRKKDIGEIAQIFFSSVKNDPEAYIQINRQLQLWFFTNDGRIL